MQITITISGEEITLTEQNCYLFRFRKRPDMDHVYYTTGERQFYIFDVEVLNKAVEDAEGTVVTANFPSDADEDAYVQFCAEGLDAELDAL